MQTLKTWQRQYRVGFIMCLVTLLHILTLSILSTSTPPPFIHPLPPHSFKPIVMFGEGCIGEVHGRVYKGGVWEGCIGGGVWKGCICAEKHINNAAITYSYCAERIESVSRRI